MTQYATRARPGSDLNVIDREVPEHLDVHLILDNYSTHKTEERGGEQADQQDGSNRGEAPAARRAGDAWTMSSGSVAAVENRAAEAQRRLGADGEPAVAAPSAAYARDRQKGITWRRVRTLNAVVIERRPFQPGPPTPLAGNLRPYETAYRRSMAARYSGAVFGSPRPSIARKSSSGTSTSPGRSTGAG
jgi:hypothetical protein